MFPPVQLSHRLHRLISFTEIVIKDREKGLTPQMAAASCKWALITRGGRFHSSYHYCLSCQSVWVTTPKDIYMLDLPRLDNLVFLVHCCTKCPFGLIFKEFDNLIWICAGKEPTLSELLDRSVIFGCSSYQVQSPLILILENKACENNMIFLLLCSHQYLNL